MVDVYRVLDFSLAKCASFLIVRRFVLSTFVGELD